MLELAILGFLHDGPVHGYELKQHLSRLTGHFRPISDGALYPAIARLEKQGFLVKTEEPGENGTIRRVLQMTPSGQEKFRELMHDVSNLDISDRNRFFTLLAFLRYLSPKEQKKILERRLDFLDAGPKRGFFHKTDQSSEVAAPHDAFRKGMLHIARETTRVERQWLRETIDNLAVLLE